MCLICYCGHLWCDLSVESDHLLLPMVQDVMLSGVVNSQMSVTSSLAAMTTSVVSASHVSMPTVAGKLSSSLTDSVFVGLPSLVPSTLSDARVAETAAATGECCSLHSLRCNDTNNDDDTHLTAIFKDNPSMLVPQCLHSGFIGAKGDGGGGDNWSHKTCKAPVKLSSPTNQTNLFTCRMPCHPTNSVKALKR